MGAMFLPNRLVRTQVLEFVEKKRKARQQSQG
jgi:hypothetical protein